MKDNRTTIHRFKPTVAAPLVAVKYLEQFRAGFDTLDIARVAGVPEPMVYNSIAWARNQERAIAQAWSMCHG